MSLATKTTSKHKHSSQPLSGDQGVAEDDDGGEHGEELPRGGHDRARQWSELGHAPEDEVLSESAGDGEQDDLPDDAGVPLHEAHEVPQLAAANEGDAQVQDGPLVHGPHHVAGLGLVLALHPLLNSAGQTIAGQRDQQQDLSDT